jgi:hypothetical protein
MGYSPSNSERKVKFTLSFLKMRWIISGYSTNPNIPEARATALRLLMQDRLPFSVVASHHINLSVK